MRNEHFSISIKSFKLIYLQHNRHVRGKYELNCKGWVLKIYEITQSLDHRLHIISLKLFLQKALATDATSRLNGSRGCILLLSRSQCFIFLIHSKQARKWSGRCRATVSLLYLQYPRGTSQRLNNVNLVQKESGTGNLAQEIFFSF